MRNYIYILILALGSLLISCGDDSCTLETESVVICNFNVENTSIKSDSIFVYSEEWVDTINNWELTDTELSFLLSPNDTITNIIIANREFSETDTLKFIHENEIVYLSPECGFIVNFSIDTVISTYNVIDSISLTNDNATNENNGIVEIYYL